MQIKIDPETGTVAEQAYLLHVIAAAYPNPVSFGRTDYQIGVETGPMPEGKLVPFPVVDRVGIPDPVKASPPCETGPGAA